MANISPVNAFTPGNEIADPMRFSGRDEQLQSLATALESEGAQIVIYGYRGIGKSSLARQLECMSQDDEKVIERLRAKPSESFDFLPIYVRCDDSVTSIPRLLVRLLSDDEALASWISFRVIEKEGQNEIGGKLDVKVVSVGAKDSQSLREAAQEVEQDIVSVFTNAVNNIVRSKVAKHGVLLIIDEFDRIKDRAGVASLIKTLGPKGVTFALVGVATTVQELITEHESVARQLADGSVETPAMNYEEMIDIFDRAERHLGGKYHFDLDAREWIINLSRGHPFYVHLVSKHALLGTIEQHQTLVTKTDAENAMKDIALKGSAPIQESLYKSAIGHSYIREAVLKAFADVQEDEIHTTQLYASLAKRLSIDPGAISVYVGQLGTEKFGAVLQKTRERYYRFTDSLFKAYAAARPWQLAPGDLEDVQ